MAKAIAVISAQNPRTFRRPSAFSPVEYDLSFTKGRRFARGVATLYPAGYSTPGDDVDMVRFLYTVVQPSLTRY
jgi:hypothetical protein